MENDLRNTCSVRWLVPVSALTILLCVITKYISAGWFTIFLFPFIYIPVLVIHAKVLAVAFRASETPEPGSVSLMYASNLFLLAAFLVQVDAGDGPKFMAIFSVLHAFGLSSESPFRLGDGWIAVNFLAFIPVAITWALMLIVSLPEAHERPEDDTE